MLSIKQHWITELLLFYSRHYISESIAIITIIIIALIVIIP